MTEAKTRILPGATLGLLGGGQLGRMFAQAAATMGYHVVVLEPGCPSPAGEVAREQIAAPYSDPQALDRLAQKCAAVTTEFENVPAASLARLAQKGLVTAPRPEAVSVTQDRNLEKAFIARAGVPVAPHCAVRSESDIASIDETLFPGILKTARLGYDGKGQAGVNSKADVLEAFRRFGTECILEKRLPLRLEVSVIVCRSLDGSIATFPISENFHRGGILAVSVLPARIPEETARRARDYAGRIARALDYVGVLCVELFVLEDGRILANELAPRPHNSGHATIDACVSSQYEAQVRTMTGMPVGETRQHTPAVMLNILGDEWLDEAGEKREPDWAGVLAVPGARLHLYGKAEARRARKMGHVTVLGATLDEALERARAVARVMRLPEPR